MDFNETRTIFGEMVLFTNHAGIFEFSFRFTLSIIFLCLGARLLKIVFLFLIIVTLLFSSGCLRVFGCSGLHRISLRGLGMGLRWSACVDK